MNNKIWIELDKFRFETFSKIRHDSLQQKYVLLLTTRVTELCKDAIVLIESQRLSSISIILRSVLESYIDLKHIIKNPEYIKKMNESFEIYKIKVLEGKKQKNRTMSIKEKFKLVGELETYEVLYANLCRSSHGNLEILIQHHSIEDQVSVEHIPNQEELSKAANQVLALATTSLIECLTFFNFSDESMKRLKKIQQAAGKGEYRDF